MTSGHIKKLALDIDPLRQQLIHHPLYAHVQTIDNLKIFMQYHVFAVWDFMSLLKALQRNLTCVQVPWIPIGNPETRYLINEIVLGEESDVDEKGNRISHFELYIQAMQEVGCDLTHIDALIKNLRERRPLTDSISAANIPMEAASFINNTFSFIDSGHPHIQAAVFTFGREDLIPGMFITLVQELNKRTPNSIGVLKYYLERHIEVDGDHHAHLAYKMTEELCGADDQKWQEATEAVKSALQHRIRLWDFIGQMVNPAS